MIGTSTPQISLDSFTLELPKGDTAFLRALAKKMGWTVKRNRHSMTSYERSLRDLEEERVYEYESLDDLIKEIEE